VDAVRQRLDLGDCQAAGLLTVDVFSRFGGQQRTQRVPVVACGNQNSVDVPPRKQFAEIPIHGTILVPIVIVGHPLDLGASASLHVANRDELHVLFRQHHAQIILTARTQPNPGKNDPLTRSNRAIQPQDTTGKDQRDRQTCSTQESAFQEVTSAQVLSMPGSFHVKASLRWFLV